LDVARGAKVKCPACGAKNKADDRRCRVCTAIINPDAPQADERKPVDPETPATQEVAASAAIQIPDSGAGSSPFSGPARGESKLSAALDGRDDVPDLAAGQTAAAQAGAGAPVYDETFEPIEIDPALRPRPPDADAGPPPPLSDETFDPGSLEIDPARRPRPGGAPPPPVGEDEPFDPDALVIDDPADPRSSS
jgi:hypothetical protein